MFSPGTWRTNPATDTIYGLGKPTPGDTINKLLIFNRTTGAATAIGPGISGLTGTSGLAFDAPHHRILAFDNAHDKFYAYDTSGNATPLPVVAPVVNTWGVAYDGHEAVVQLVNVDNNTKLAYVDPDAGLQTALFALSGPALVEALHYVPGEPLTHRVSVAPEQLVENITFGNFQLVNISGQKFDDRNGNGAKDPGEPGLAGWTIQLDLNNDGSIDQTQVTDANGNYTFTGIGPGAHKLSEVPQPGWAQTCPTPVPPGTYLVTTQSGQNLAGRDFGNHDTTPAAVVSATPNVATVTDNNVGTATFSVRIVYNEAMNTNLNPVVTFTPHVPGTLTYDAAWSWWTSDRTFVARYDVADANVAVASIGIGAASAHDASGNVQTAYNGTNSFSIDTLGAPSPTAAVASATPNLATVTDNNVGTATFSVRIVYNEAMNTDINPVVTFTPGVSGTLTYDRAWSWWTSDRTFVARYDVADANVAVASIGIGVASAHDASGNVQTAYNGTNNFSIDTLGTPAPRQPSSAQRRIWRR